MMKGSTEEHLCTTMDMGQSMGLGLGQGEGGVCAGGEKEKKLEQL